MPLNENIREAQVMVWKVETLLSELHNIRRSDEDGDELVELEQMTHSFLCLPSTPCAVRNENDLDLLWSSFIN